MQWCFLSSKCTKYIFQSYSKETVGDNNPSLPYNCIAKTNDDKVLQKMFKRVFKNVRNAKKSFLSLLSSILKIQLLLHGFRARKEYANKQTNKQKEQL